MGTTFSTDQQAVIDSRNENLLVAAAAGSGKTTVLVERIIRRLLDKDNPIFIDRILVVTFTNAAAKEMKERILDALEAELVKDPLNEHLQRQATLIHNACITTIDSFCLDVLRNNFHKIGVDPSFRVANEGEIKLIKQDAMDNIMEAAYEKGDEEFYNLIDCYIKKDKDTTIEENIDDLHSFAMSYPEPEKWLLRQKNEYFYDDVKQLEESKLIKQLTRIIITLLDRARPILDRILNVSKESNGPSLFEPVAEKYIEFNENAIKLLENGEIVKFSEEMSEYKLPQFPRNKQECDPDLLELARNLRAEYKGVIDEIKKRYVITSLEDELNRLRLAGRVVAVMTDLTIDYMKEFARLKRERGVIDFCDMEHFALNILLESFEDINNYKVTDVAREYQQRFDEVMIDEYQDSNLVQEILLAAVSHQGTDLTPNRFMVGDVKQSIYRFRLARPQIFMEKEALFKNGGKSSKVIHLKENYRSRSEVIDSVNKIFYSVMIPEFGGLEYTADEALYARASLSESPSDNTTELVLVEKEGRKAKDARKLEAQALCTLINSLVGHHMVYDRKLDQLRPASYKDIAVLASKPSNIRDILSETFEENKIPFHLEGVGTFYKAKEIQDIINVLRIFDNPLSDIPLFGAMSSYFGDFEPELVAQIKAEAAEEEYYLWDKLTGFVSRKPDNKKASDFVSFVNRYRDLSVYTPIGELITELVTETGYLLFIAADQNGKQREANVELLIKKATDYSKTSFSGIFHFLRYIELFEKTGQDEGEAGIFEENSDVVRIMSIHKSKGLEFPICFVIDIDDDFSNKDRTGEFILDIDAGIGAKAIDPVARTKATSLKREIIARKILEECLGEQIRLLYVAMTRAKEKLILLGTVKDAKERLEKADSIGTGSFLQLMLKAIKEEDSKYFKIRNINPEEIPLIEAGNSIAKLENRAAFERVQASEKQIEDIQKAIMFEYPYKALEKLCIKTTVSNLKMAAMEEVQGETEALFKEREREEYIPSFAGGKSKVSGTDRGTAYHSIMQLIDFSKEVSKNGWEEQIKEAVRDEIITAEEAGLVNLDKLLCFAESPMALRMHEAAKRGELYKEQPFVMGISADKVNKDFPTDEIVLLQGVIDVYFVENDEIVVLDYKTDKVKSAEELSLRYQAQLDYYADALTKLTGKRVKEKALYSFGLNEDIMLK